MKRKGLILVAVLIISALMLPLIYLLSTNQSVHSEENEYFFGVTYGQTTVEDAIRLIDRVESYTNVFVVDSTAISENQTMLNTICSYAAQKNLHFMVYFFSLYSYEWQQEWVVNAKQTWNDKFLGVYLRDEPGGRQIEKKNETVAYASNYSDAAEKYVEAVSEAWSMKFLKEKVIPVVTSDFALYWFDYQAGFDVIFAQLGWNNSRPQEIGLCRGAAKAHGRDWGTIITWTYQKPPYLATGPQIYQDMVASYKAGAKYILIFNYPTYPEANPYGILYDEHFLAMQQFWEYAQANPRDHSNNQTEAAMLLPKDYGWGMRTLNDTIWGFWPPDEFSALIWQNVNVLVAKHGLKLDIVYDGYGIDFSKVYSKVYLWNETIT